MKQNRKFALSTIALLIQSVVAMQAKAVEYNLEETEFVQLPDQPGAEKQITYKGRKLTVNQTILPYWEKGKMYRKLEAVTTGEGADGNLLVNGSYGIRSFAEQDLGYQPELLVKSNNNIIFNNDFQGVEIQSNSGNITLEAKNEINFNLNITDKKKNIITDQEVLVNNKGLLEYDNYIPEGKEKKQGHLLLKSAKGNLLNMSANIHKDTHHFGIKNFYNNNVSLTATEGDNVISITGKLVDPINAGEEIQSKSHLIGIDIGLNSNTTLTGENNKVEIKTTGEGLGLGIANTSTNNSYSSHTSAISVIGQHSKKNELNFAETSSIKLKATKGNNEINVVAKSHSLLKGIIASNGSKATLEASDDNIVKVKNPDKNTKLMKKPFDTTRIGIQAGVDSDIVLDGKNNIVELAGNPIYQSGISTDGDSTVTLTAKEDNKITVENAVVASEGIATLVTNAGDKQSKRGTGNQVILEAGNDNIITMKANDEDMSIADASTVLKETKSYTEKSGSKGLYSYGKNSLIKLTGKNNIIKSELKEKVKKFEHHGLHANTHGKIELTAINNNEIKGAKVGLYTDQSASITLKNSTNNIVEASDYGIQAFRNSTQSLTATEGNTIIGENFAVYSNNEETSITLNAKNNSVKGNYGLTAYNKSKQSLIATENNTIIGGSNPNQHGVYTTKESTVSVTGKSNIVSGDYGLGAYKNSTQFLTATKQNKVTGQKYGIYTNNEGTNVTLSGKENLVVGSTAGLAGFDKSVQTLSAEEQNKIGGQTYGVYSKNEKTAIKLTGKDNIIAGGYGLLASDKSKQALIAKNKNQIIAQNAGVFSSASEIKLNTDNINTINADGKDSQGLYAINQGTVSLDGMENNITAKKYGIQTQSSTVSLRGANKNEIKDAEFGIFSKSESGVSLSSENENIIKSTSVGLYSQDKSTIALKGRNNTVAGVQFGLLAQNEGKQILEATNENNITGGAGIYAKNNSKVNLTGLSHVINVSNTAIHSLDKSEVSIDGQITIHSNVANVARRDNSLINLRYKNNSDITGATVSDGGNVSITPLNDSDVNVMRLTGDVLAVNKGKVELDFTPNSRLVGRLDNFSGLTDSKHKDLFDQYVTKLDSKSAGEINLNLAKDAVWTMTGQSWLDKLSGEGTIDFNNDAKTSGRALHIGELAGANKFLMHLNKDGIHSDMLYVKKGTSTPQEVVVKNLSEVLDSMNYGERLRFATVTDSKNEFVNGKKYIDDTHLLEQALTVEYSDHRTDPSNNEDYNRRFNGETMTAEKAGNTDVDAMYGSEHRKNVYLVKQTTGNPSRNVKNINDMFDSTAHYAFTLDTYTKREGERAFSTLDKKEGDWIRLTHTRLIQSNAFRFHNNDFEIGYDRFSLNEQEKKRKWGISFDYGHGRTSLWNTFGKGKIRKYELALYNTTQYIDKEGDETGYIDNVLKIGKLRNRVIARNHMGKLWGTGKYSNTLFSISTEYGRRKFLDDDKLWRITPQVQLQYSYLRGAGYRLDNGISVNLSHANSLIGRLGLDVVRKFDEDKKLFYVKGNILHEFLGSRSFKAFEGNSSYAQKWNTRGTWYSVGLGYNARTGKKTYVFADAEKEFSGGKKGSYNIRLSVSHQFD